MNQFVEDILLEIEEEYGIQLHDIGVFMGAGSRTQVYDIVGSNKVIKFEDTNLFKGSKKEFYSGEQKKDILSKLINVPLKYTTKIYYVRLFSNGVLVTVAEKVHSAKSILTNLTDSDEIILDSITYSWQELDGKEFKDEDFESDLNDTVEEIKDNFQPSFFEQTLEKPLLKKYLNDVYNGFKELSMHDIDVMDIHLLNVGYSKKTNTFKLLDFLI